MIWLGEKRGYLPDWITQIWVKLTGKKVKFKDYQWILGPTGSPRVIADEYIYRLSKDLSFEVVRGESERGLVENFKDYNLTEEDFKRLDPEVIRFYAETSSYDFEIWSKWNKFWEPGGRLLAAIFSKRLKQLNVPLDPLDTAFGLDSEVIKLKDLKTGETMYTVWYRKLVRTGEIIYSGTYGLCQPSNEPTACLKVIFPLPNGSATVILKPKVNEDGSFTLLSQGKKIGDAGFYFLLKKDDETGWLRYVKAMHESLHVYTDKKGVLRTDHILNMWGSKFLHLHYKMQRKGGN